MSAVLLPYKAIRLLDVHADAIEPWDATGATHIRAALPAMAENVVAMQRKGFVWADRTLGVIINLTRATLDYDKLVRMQIVETTDYKEDILCIAQASFLDDRRFHILPQTDQTIANEVIAQWVKALDVCLVCLYKARPVGFLALRETESDTQFIHLAAVEEKYRAAGAALSLYAQAVVLCKARGFKKLEGRISSRNTAVMNLYAYLGASFLSPTDIFLKELQHDA